MGEERAEALEFPSVGEGLDFLRIPTVFICILSSVFGILTPSSSCSFGDIGLETTFPLVMDVTEVTLPDFKVS